MESELASSGPRQPVFPTQPSEPMNLMLGLPGRQVMVTPLA